MDANGPNISLWPDFSFRFARALRRFDPAEYRGVEQPSLLPLSGARTTQAA